MTDLVTFMIYLANGAILLSWPFFARAWWAERDRRRWREQQLIDAVVKLDS